MYKRQVVDSLIVHDPYNNRISEVIIPTEGSFTQFVTADDNGDIWFVEQRGAKIGKVSISSVPGQTTILQESPTFEIKYVEIVAPLVSAGIIVTALFYVKSIRDKRKIDEMINKKSED